MARKHPEARKLEILDAAQKLFHSHGYETVRVDDILDSVGISKGGFYHHFKSKEDVLREIVRTEHRQFAEALDHSLVNTSPVASLLTLFELGSSELKTVEPDSLAPKGVVTTLHSFAAKSIYLDELETLFEIHTKPLLHAILERGIHTGEFRPIDAAATVEIFFAINNHGNRQYLLADLSAEKKAAFTDTSLELLGTHLGIADDLAHWRNQR